MLLTVSVVLVASIILAISAFVLARNQKSSINLVFSIFGLSVGLWILANFFGANFKSSQASLYFLRADFFLGPWMAYLFWKFTTRLSSEIPASIKIIDKALLLLTVCISFGGLTNFIAHVTRENQLTVIEYNSAYTIYSTLLLGVSLMGLFLLFWTYRRVKNQAKSQVSIMIWGLGTAIVFVMVPNLLVPQLTNSKQINLLTGNLAYIGLAFFILATSYAIVKHRLFDVRLVVARSLAYVLTLASIVIMYSLCVFGLFATLGGTELPIVFQQVFYLITATLLGLTFLPLKRFFDKGTARLFYRDAYDTQVLLNDFNRTLVSTIELEKLLERAGKTIEKYVRPEFCAFALLNTPDGTIRLMEKGRSPHVSKELIEQSRAYLHDFNRKLFITDSLENKYVELQLLMQQTNIGAIIRVSKTQSQEGLGYMVLGYKKSGNIYNSQDTATLEIIANELAIAIENALRFEEIQNFAETLQAKVDEATSNLRKANEKLKEMDQTKDDFISMASHQLRTPLTSVKGYISMVLEGDVGKISAQQRKLLDQSYVSSQRMVYLIADLLNVSRLKTGKFIIEAKPVNLADIVEGEIAQLTETAKGRNLTLKYDKPKDFPLLMLDETKIRQVIMNFADNAVYYTPTGGHINVIVEDKGSTIEFRVEDDGIGVPKTEQHNLFNKFYRAGNAKKARPDGTGLGLFMAKKVVVAQGGSIIFHSEEGKGSTFGFTFSKSTLDPKNYKSAKQPQLAADSKK